MRTNIPKNHVKFDYINILDKFVSLLTARQGDNIKCIYLSGSYARGDATNSSDIDLFCVFNVLNYEVLNDVGFSVKNTFIPYDDLEINPQCVSIDEFNRFDFNEWTEKSLRILDSVLIYGEDFWGYDILIDELKKICKRYLVDTLMSVRHYISVQEPIEKLTYKKFKNYILKPLMFSLRIERYCSLGFYPLTINDLENSLNNDEKYILCLFKNESIYNESIKKDHSEVLKYIHNIILKILNFEG